MREWGGGAVFIVFFFLLKKTQLFPLFFFVREVIFCNFISVFPLM